MYDIIYLCSIKHMEVVNLLSTWNILINSLIAAGGIGFINLFILLRLDKLNFTKDNKEDKSLFLLFFSIINYGIFLLVQSMLESLPVNGVFRIILALIITLAVSIILSFFVWIPVSKLIVRNINFGRKKEQLSSYDSRSIKKIAFSFDENKPIFIFDFDNKLIFSGMSGWFSDLDGADFEFLIYPFNQESELNDYQKLVNYISSEDIDSEVYINVNRKIKIIILN